MGRCGRNWPSLASLYFQAATQSRPSQNNPAWTMDGWAAGGQVTLDANPAGTHCRFLMPLVAGLRDASRETISEQPTRLGWFLTLFQPGTTAAVHAAHSTEAGAPTSLASPHSCSPGTKTKGLWVLGTGCLVPPGARTSLANHGLASTQRTCHAPRAKCPPLCGCLCCAAEDWSFMIMIMTHARHARAATNAPHPQAHFGLSTAKLMN